MGIQTSANTPAGAVAAPVSGAAVTSSTPSAQLAAALVGVGPIPAGEHAGGAGQGTRLTIALAPPAIGTVSLQIDRNADGSSAIAIGATHQATLDQLQNDRSGLEQMLTQAGVPVDHRALSFHLVAARPDATGSMQAGVGGGAAGFGFGAGGQAGSQSRGSNHGPSGAAPAWRRAGLGEGIALPGAEIPSSAGVTLRRFGVNVMA